MFETPNKDFTMHLGGWFQWDNVWWNQSPGMTTAPVKQTTNQGVAADGIGPLEDGDTGAGFASSWKALSGKPTSTA